MDPRPITLTGRHVRLEPLSPAHAPDLFAAFKIEPAILRWWLLPMPNDLPAFESKIKADLEKQANGSVVLFAQVDPASARAVGQTSYMNISRYDRGLEIGSTWLGKPWQRTGINTEAKYLLLRHAFEDLGAVRVQLKTDGRNTQSQRAIERLGAVREGVLRKYQRVWDGVTRDSVMFSITDDEWPAVKVRLEGLLAARHGSGRGEP
jgi:RimJ/RimL family protein N-acetyltransferase